MNAKTIFTRGLGIVVLPILYFACFALANGFAFALLNVTVEAPPLEEAAATGPAFVIVSVVNALVLAHLTLRSRWWGWKLSAGVFIIFYGAHTFLAQLESAVFLSPDDLLPPGMLPAIFLAGAILGGLFVPLAVLFLGKRKQGAASDESNSRLVMPAREWAWKLAVIAAAYVILYFTFGYYVAWRNPAVQAYYGGTDPGSFFLQMGYVLRETPWMPFFQMFRALLWALIALPVIRMMKGHAWETALAVGLAYAVLMNSVHLFPNAIMPQAVRIAHLLETASSNFIFGVIVGGLLLWRPSGVRALASPTKGAQSNA